jgi:2,4-dienoyl-CoA reductase-like NADH-dependent reductase (Old Yellow Enzyme family)/thioredoxin reductase
MLQLLEPYELGSTLLRNRVVVPGHTTNFGHANRPTARHAAYHEERARGGVGLIITEAIRVHPTSAGRHTSLGSFDDSSIPAYADIASAVHRHGTKIFAQLMHAGRQANGDATRTAAWSASPIPWSGGAATPHQMGRDDLSVLVSSFADAARRMRESGYDGLEIHLGHGHLLQQFLSPVTNQRTDEYGGSRTNRLRLVREVLTAVGSASGTMSMGVRVSADEFLEGGLTPTDVIEIVGDLREEFPLAYVHVSHSAYHASYSLSTQIADMSFGHAPFRHHARLFKEALPGLPVIAVCRLDSLSEAAELVADGSADLVGLARPHIADPHLVAKALAGQADQVTSCLACNQGCIGRLEQNLPISCVVNPEVGAEAEWRSTWQSVPASDGRRVLVIGGGPAGMHAAIAAQRCGHSVTLIESGPELGGQMRYASQVPGRERLGLLVRDLTREIERLGVHVRLGETVTSSDVNPGDWDDVVIATGSAPSHRDFGGGTPVLTTHEVASLVATGARMDGLRVVLVDEEGGWTSASLAEACARLGADVHIVTPSDGLASRITTYSRLALIPRLAQLGVQAHLMKRVILTAPGKVAMIDTLSARTTTLEDVSFVIDGGRPSACDDLYRELDGQAGVPRTYVVGDANSPRTALEAVYEGRLAGTFLNELHGDRGRLVTFAT